MHIEMYGPTDKDRLNRLGLEPVIARRVRVTLLLVDICNMNIQGPFLTSIQGCYWGLDSTLSAPSSTLKPL